MKKMFLSLVEATFTYLSILIYNNVIFKTGSYNILFLMAFFIFFNFYYKDDLKINNKIKKYSLILGLCFSLILSIGSIVSTYISKGPVIIFGLKNFIYAVISTVGFTILFFKVFKHFFHNMGKIQIVEEHSDDEKKIFIIGNIIILMVHSLYFIRYYPGIMTADSYAILHNANNFILDDFNTFGHTWFVGAFFHLGKFLFHNMNAAVAFFIIIQMIIMSFIFTAVIRFLYKKGLSKRICVSLFAFYALNPLHAHYSVTLWRDVMFGGSFVLLLISLYEMVDCKKTETKYYILFVIGSLIMLFFRNNGIYIFLFMFPFIIFLLKYKRFLMIIMCGCIIIVYFIIKGPVFDCLNVRRSTPAEAYSIPYQQIARVISSGAYIDDSHRKYFERLFSYDQISESYNPIVSNSIKNLSDSYYLDDNKAKFFSNYVTLFFQYPRIYVEAYMLQTLGYWYPDTIYWATGGESSSIFESEDIYTNSLTPDWYNSIIDSTTSRRVPFNNLIWSVGLPFLLLIFSSFVMFYLGKKKYIVSFVPLYGLWISIMLAAPVYSELRYVYGLFTCLPLFLLLPYIDCKKGIIKSK